MQDLLDFSQIMVYDVWDLRPLIRNVTGIFAREILFEKCTVIPVHGGQYEEGIH